MRTLSCPHCGFSKKVPAERIPAGVKRIKCPKCQQAFELNGEPSVPGQAPLVTREEGNATEPSAPAPKPSEKITITCPHCHIERSVPRDKIPSRTVTLQCQQCKEKFSFNGDIKNSTPAQNAPEQDAPEAPGPTNPEPPSKHGSRSRLSEIPELFSRSLEVFKRRILTLIGINLLAVVLAIAAYLVLGTVLDSIQGWFGNSAIVIFLAGLVMVGFTLLVMSAVGGATVMAIADESLAIRPALGLGIQRFTSFLWVFTLVGFIISGGYFLFFVPGVIFTAWFGFAQFVLAHEDVRGMDALLKSRAYVKEHFWGVLGRIAVVLAGCTLISMIPFIGPLLALVTGPFTLIFYHEIYRDLHEINTSVDYPSSRGEKAKWLLAGSAGYILVPLAGILIIGPAMMQGVSMLDNPTIDDENFAVTFNTGEQALPTETNPPSLDTDSDTATEENISDDLSSVIYVPAIGANPEQLMIYVFSINYLGDVRFNGEQLYPIKGERDMSYNYTGTIKLTPGSNMIDVEYQALPDDPWMTKLEVKVYRYDWESGQETVFSEWVLEDSGGNRQFEIVFGG